MRSQFEKKEGMEVSSGVDEYEFPTARASSAAFVYKQQLMLWGGVTQRLLGQGDFRFVVNIDLPGERSARLSALSYRRLSVALAKKLSWVKSMCELIEALVAVVASCKVC